MARAIDIVRKVAPRALPNYLTAFENGDPLLSQAGITTPLRLAHFLAQVLEETGGLTITVESGNYSAERMCEVWPSRFHSIAEATPYAHNAEKLFNMVYANRMGNGPPESGDGFKYRGRGVLQTTGRGDYQQFGKLCGVDFEGNPDLIFAPEHALKPALAEWTRANCNPLADKDDIRAITLKVNGGYTNLAERDRWLGVLKPLIKSVEFGTAPAPQPPVPTPRPKPVTPIHAGGAAAGGTAGAAAAHQAGLGIGWVIAIAVSCAVLGFIIAKVSTANTAGASK